MRRPSPNQVDHFPRVFIVDLCQKDGFLSAPARQVTTLTRTFALQVGHQPPPANSPGWQWLISFKHEILIVISTEEKNYRLSDCHFQRLSHLRSYLSLSFGWSSVTFAEPLLVLWLVRMKLAMQGRWKPQLLTRQRPFQGDNDPSRVTTTTAAAKERCGQLARRTQHSESSSWFTWWWVFLFFGAESWFWRSQVEDKMYKTRPAVGFKEMASNTLITNQGRLTNPSHIFSNPSHIFSNTNWRKEISYEIWPGTPWYQQSRNDRARNSSQSAPVQVNGSMTYNLQKIHTCSQVPQLQVLQWLCFGTRTSSFHT